MAASQPTPPSLPELTVPVGGSVGIGKYAIAPPTFLEKWGVAFVSIGGLWMLAVCVAMLWFYLAHLPPPPVMTSANVEGYRDMLALHKTATDQFRESLSFAFDLMVTKTVLPLLTLLLGYLFGSKKI